MLGTLKKACSLPFSVARRRARRVVRPSPAAPPLFAGRLPGVRVARAQVLEVLPDGRPRCRVLDESLTTAVATWAIPYRYVPREGDTLWVVSDGEGPHYVLGVARGRGRAEVWFPGDATLRAAGVLRLGADRAVRIAGKVLRMEAPQLELVAAAIQQRAGEVTRTIRGLTKLVAGRATRIVEGPDSLVTRRTRIIAADLAKLDAQQQIKLL